MTTEERQRAIALTRRSLDFIYNVIGVAAWETMISDEGTAEGRVLEAELFVYLAQLRREELEVGK